MLLNVEHAQKSKPLGVLARREDVGDHQATAGAKYTNGLVNSFVPLIRALDVVNRNIR
jgi:hypothetical protein